MVLLLQKDFVFNLFDKSIVTPTNITTIIIPIKTFLLIYYLLDNLPLLSIANYVEKVQS